MMKGIGTTLALVGSCLLASAAQALPITFKSALTPEVPGATGSGFVTVIADPLANTLEIDAIWSGLSGTTTVAHIHCCTAVPGTGTVGVAVTPVTLPDFPVGVQAGSYNRILDLTNPLNFTNNFLINFGGNTLEGARDALFAGLYDGTAYFNVHTTTFPGGEIRGFLQVPEPGSLILLSLGLVGLAGHRRLRRSWH